MEIKIKNLKNNNDVNVIPVYLNNKKGYAFFNNYKDKENYIKKLKILNFNCEPQKYIYCEINNIRYIFLGFNKDYNLEEIRRNYSVLVKAIKELKIKKLFLNLPKDGYNIIKSVVEGLLLTDYKFKNKEKDDSVIFLNISIKNKPYLEKIIKICKNINLARNLVNESSSYLTPNRFSEILVKFSKKHNLKCLVFDERRLLKEKLNLIYNVGKGSENGSKLVIIEYRGKKKDKDLIGIVGKGITFDSGGLNLKPTSGIKDMKLDMAGAAVVYSILKTIVELNININLIAAFPLAENMLNSKAYRPGDIITAYNGLNIEIDNTDAEGRLILADALSFLQKNYSLKYLIDFATLTGACMIALGEETAGLFANDNNLKKLIKESSIKVNENVWEMPINEEHRESIKSDIADLKNVGNSKYGGACTAAAFLERFIEKDIKWAHLDIAGPSFSSKDKFYIKKYGTGFGIRLFLEFINSIRKKDNLL